MSGCAAARGISAAALWLVIVDDDAGGGARCLERTLKICDVHEAQRADVHTGRTI
jgi:hypothetical protein